MKLYAQCLNNNGELLPKIPFEHFVASSASGLVEFGKVVGPLHEGLYMKLSGSPALTCNYSAGESILKGELKGIIITVEE